MFRFGFPIENIKSIIVLHHCLAIIGNIYLSFSPYGKRESEMDREMERKNTTELSL